MSTTEPKKKRSKKRTIELAAYSAFCIFGAYYCYHLKGQDGFLAALAVQEEMLLGMLPRITMALGVASLLWVLLDPEKLKKTIQKRRGWVKVVYATILGAVTPGGPSSSFSILNMFLNSGLGYLIGITYITAWSMLGVQRILIWDIPLMGTEQAGLRFISGFWLPAFAGLFAAWVFGKYEDEKRPC
jgi:uncharacterized membrane protein YraQ (UPF0718 family)